MRILDNIKGFREKSCLATTIGSAIQLLSFNALVGPPNMHRNFLEDFVLFLNKTLMNPKIAHKKNSELFAKTQVN